VPLLGDIPGIGWLFKSKSTNSTETNMFIFITPKIIRNPAHLAGVTLQKEDSMGTVMPQTKEVMHPVVNKEHAMVLTEKGFTKLLANKNFEAKEYFQEALAYDSKNPYTLLNIGVVSEREGEYDSAIQFYQQVIMTGTTATAVEASDPSKQGLPLLQIARENIERLQQEKREQ
jgi:general secretion pathway protein D